MEEQHGGALQVVTLGQPQFLDQPREEIGYGLDVSIDWPSARFIPLSSLFGSKFRARVQNTGEMDLGWLIEEQARQ